MLEQAFVQGAQEPGSPADPVSQCGAVEFNALPGVDLRLAIERKVIGVLRRLVRAVCVAVGVAGGALT
jgi:hypothetical protein